MEYQGAKVHDAVPYQFLGRGIIRNEAGEKKGRWSLDKGIVIIHLPEGNFTGVLISQIDEAGNPVLAMSPLSDKNEAVWAVKYSKKEEIK